MNMTADQKQTLLEALRKTCGIFWGPDRRMCEKILQVSFFDAFEKLIRLPKATTHHTIDEINSILKNLSDAGTLYSHLEESYVRLFISHRNGIQAPLYESCYAGTKSGEIAPLMGEPAVAMQKRLQDRGVSIGNDIHEPPDHISIELEYLYFLLEKGWQESDPRLIDEAATFAAQNMFPWVSKLQNRLTGEIRCRFYPLMVSLLLSILDRIAKIGQAPLSD